MFIYCSAGRCRAAFGTLCSESMETREQRPTSGDVRARRAMGWRNWNRRMVARRKETMKTETFCYVITLLLAVLWVFIVAHVWVEADHQPPPEENGLHESNTILLRINLCDAFEFEKDNKMRVLREKKSWLQIFLSETESVESVELITGHSTAHNK